MYDDYDDEYEEDGGYQDEEDEEDNQVEDEVPSQAVQDFLKLREKFKENIRQKYKKEQASASAPGRSLAKSGTANTKFGSFFGPSQSVIAPRVLEESRSIRETKHVVSKAQSSTSTQGKHVSSNGEVKYRQSSQQPKVVNELKRKAQTLKERRDYSFLLSDDSDLPATENSVKKNVPAPKDRAAPRVGAQPGRSLPPPKMSMGKPKSILGNQFSRETVPRDQHAVKKGEHRKMIPPSRPKASSIEPKRLQGGHHKIIAPSGPRASSVEPRKLFENRDGGGLSQPSVSKSSSLAAQGALTKKASVMGSNKSSNVQRVPLATKPAAVRGDFSQHRRDTQVPKARMTPKQASSSSWPQMSKTTKQIQQRSMHEDRPKQKPVKSRSRGPFDDEDDDIDDPMSFLRNNLLSRFNSSKYHGNDEDDSDMEANFDDIMEEERRSSRIAQREDEEQLRLIEEEERRERMRKEAKRRKLMQT